jgi:hypothetical protein
VTAELHSITVTPSIAGLAYSHALPAGWQQVPLPEEQVDFSQPVFLPLGVNMAPYGAVLFTVAARPAFDDGSVYEWMLYLCRREEFEIRSAMPVCVAGRDMIECGAIQQTDAGPMRLRLLMFEDGGRIFQISAMAPEAIWGSLESMFQEMLDSFQLHEPRGARLRSFREAHRQLSRRMPPSHPRRTSRTTPPPSRRRRPLAISACQAMYPHSIRTIR